MAALAHLKYTQKLHRIQRKKLKRWELICILMLVGDKKKQKVFLSFPPVVADSSLRETPPWGQLGLSTAADGKGYFIKCTPEVWEEWEEEDVNLNTADCINALSPSSFHVSFLQLKSKWQRYRHFRGQKKRRNMKAVLLQCYVQHFIHFLLDLCWCKSQLSHLWRKVFGVCMWLEWWRSKIGNRNAKENGDTVDIALFYLAQNMYTSVFHKHSPSVVFTLPSICSIETHGTEAP